MPRELAGLVEQDVDPWSSGEEPWPVFLDRQEDVLQVWTRYEDHGHSPEHREIHHDGESVHVEERHDREHAIALAHRRVPRAALIRVRDQRAVGQHGAFRDAGRAAGVLEHGEIGRRDGHARGHAVVRDQLEQAGDDPIKAQALSPPILYNDKSKIGEGARVHTDWLHGFLSDPSALRQKTPLERYSCAKSEARWPGNHKHADLRNRRVTAPGWWNRAMSSVSRWNRSRNLGSAAMCSCMTLTTTSRPRSSWRAR